MSTYFVTLVPDLELAIGFMGSTDNIRRADLKWKFRRLHFLKPLLFDNNRLNRLKSAVEPIKYALF